MPAVDSNWTGRYWAKHYDAIYGPGNITDPAVTGLQRYFPEGARLLEVGIGTGRVALPLARSGRKLFGVDISAEMIGVLQSKPESLELDGLAVVDACDMSLGQQFDGTFAVFNTLFAILDASRQLAALQRMAEHTKPGGLVIVENSNPAGVIRGYAYGQGLFATGVSEAELNVLAGRLDLAAQRLDLAHLAFSEGEVRYLPAHARFVWPNEMLLMGENAGLQTVEVLGDWDGRPYSETTSSMIAVLRRPPQL